MVGSDCSDGADRQGIVLARMAAHKKVEDMINIGAYAHGSNPEIDKAIATLPEIHTFLKQDITSPCSFEESAQMLEAVANA